MRKFVKFFTFALATTMIYFASCNLDNNDLAPEGTGRVVVSITDAPFPVGLVDKVLVTVDTVELRKEGGNCTGKNGEPIGKIRPSKGKGFDYSRFRCDSGYVVISTGEKEFDLLQLQNGVTEILADAQVPVGTYDIIRMELVKAVIYMDEYTFTINIPESANNGLRIRLDTVLVVDGSTTAGVLVDLDLSRSFVTMGNHKAKGGILGFIFNPMIRAVNQHRAGSIHGRVMEDKNTPVAGALITVMSGDKTVSTAITGEKGLYRIIGLPVGTYQVSASKEGYNTKTSDDIKIYIKRDFRQDFLLSKK